MLETLFKLLIGFAVADFALQSPTTAKGKNRKHVPDYIPEGQKLVAVWPYYLTGHAMINAGAVWVVTGMWQLAFTEFILHWVIDFIKCENWTNPHQDQLLHLVCRIIYTVWSWGC